VNIFILDDDTQLCAQAHSDIHVNKMATEAGQILTSALAWVLRSYSEVPASRPGTTKKVFHRPFEGGWGVSHPYHPATLWTADTFCNFLYTYQLGMALCREWHHRFGKQHGSHEMICRLSTIPRPSSFSPYGITPHVIAFDKERYADCIRPTVVESYRAYYNHAKLHLKGKPATGITSGQLIMGIAAEAIALNGFGLVSSFGLVRGFNTTGTPYGETWADGDILYYNPSFAGGLSKNLPAAPTPHVVVAAVVNAATAGSGSVFVRVQSEPLVSQLSDVYAPTPATGDVLVYDGVQQRWESGPLTPSSLPASVKSNLVLTWLSM